MVSSSSTQLRMPCAIRWPNQSMTLATATRSQQSAPQKSADQCPGETVPADEFGALEEDGVSVSYDIRGDAVLTDMARP